MANALRSRCGGGSAVSLCIYGAKRYEYLPYRGKNTYLTAKYRLFI